MSTHDNTGLERIKFNDGLLSNGCGFDFVNFCSQSVTQPDSSWQSTGGAAGIDIQPQTLMRRKKPSTAILSRFESSTSAFYATERFMAGFAQSPLDKSQSSEVNFPLDSSGGQSYSKFRNTLQSVVQPHLLTNSEYHGVSDRSVFKNPPSEEYGSAIRDDSNLAASISIPLQWNLEDKLCPPGSANNDLYNFSRSIGVNQYLDTSSSLWSSRFSPGPNLSSKTRIRWTQDLHEKFVECVNCLGGSEKATPKAILKLMDLDGLTIFHVKSHLQKYRTAKYVSEAAQGKDKRSSTGEIAQLDVKAGLQIKEALQMQLDVQKSLHDQLEIQRNLQLRIEEQGRQLRMMFDKHQKTNESSPCVQGTPSENLCLVMATSEDRNHQSKKS